MHLAWNVVERVREILDLTATSLASESANLDEGGRDHLAEYPLLLVIRKDVHGHVLSGAPQLLLVRTLRPCIEACGRSLLYMGGWYGRARNRSI